MKFRTEISVSPSPFLIHHSMPLLTIGSCFSDNIGHKLVESGFMAWPNPFGAVYNPISISRLIDISLQNRVDESLLLIQHNGLWHSLHHHGKFSHANRESLLSTLKKLHQQVAHFLQKCQYIFITWGSAEVYEWNETHTIVANCHKIPASFFHQRLLKIEEITKSFTILYNTLQQHNPTARIVLSISPVRYLNESFFKNHLNKARLFLAAEEILTQYPEKVLYFPAYEIMMDDLRDYRFYADDLRHPSPPAIEYIWEKFCIMFFDPSTRSLMNNFHEYVSMRKHRLHHPQSQETAQFIRKLTTKREHLYKQYPQNIEWIEQHIDLSSMAE